MVGNLPAAIAGVATFEGSITFSLIMSGVQDPANHDNQLTGPNKKSRFDVVEIRGFLAISWVVFVALLGTSGLMSTLLAFYRGQFVEGFAAPTRKQRSLGDSKVLSRLTYAWSLHTASFLLSGLLTTSFVYLSLVVVAYAEKPGWTGVGISSMFGLVTFIIWFKKALDTFRDRHEDCGGSTQSPSAQRALIPKS